MTGSGHNVARFIYKRARLDDLEKMGLRSHKPEQGHRPTGGGARDIRFRPWPEFQPVVRRMFPDDVVYRRKTCYLAELHWTEMDGSVRHKPVRFCPPSGARGPEGWIAESYKIPAFTNDLPQSEEPPAFIMVVQDNQGTAWGGWAKEADLRRAVANAAAGSVDHDDWHPEVAQVVLNALDSWPPKTTVRGFVDFVTGREGHFGRR